MQIDLSVALDPNKLRDYKREHLDSIYARDLQTKERAHRNAESLLEALLGDVKSRVDQCQRKLTTAGQ